MSLVYLGVGIFLFISPYFPQPWNSGLAVLFTVYGVFRVYKALKKII